VKQNIWGASGGQDLFWSDVVSKFQRILKLYFKVSSDIFVLEHMNLDVSTSCEMAVYWHAILFCGFQEVEDESI
jgi:hypothetical protein